MGGHEHTSMIYLLSCHSYYYYYLFFPSEQLTFVHICLFREGFVKGGPRHDITHQRMVSQERKVHYHTT